MIKTALAIVGGVYISMCILAVIGAGIAVVADELCTKKQNRKVKFSKSDLQVVRIFDGTCNEVCTPTKYL